MTTRQEGLLASERALAIDPESVDARIGIANNLVANILDSWSTSPAQDAARAEQLLNEALERNTGSAWAHFTMGMLRRWQNRLPESKIELETAIALNRNYSFALRQLCITLTFLGQPKAAIPLVEKSIRLDPHSPNIHVAYWAFGCCHLLLGHVDAAVDLFRKARAANPRLAYSNWGNPQYRVLAEKTLVRINGHRLVTVSGRSLVLPCYPISAPCSPDLIPCSVT